VRRFVFLDRDGTLVRDTGHPHRLEDYVLLPGVIPALRRLAEAGYCLAIVTNQSGIGRGLFGPADFERFQSRLLSELEAGGVHVEATYVCPHAPDTGCPCRKPEPGMLWRAREELGADLAQSWVIGDGARDCGLARRAGCRGAVRVGPTDDDEEAWAPRAPDLPAAVQIVLDAGHGAP
jgi:histidinol-phosphate phosphatase family protein